MGGFVYILASRKHGTLYVGVTNDLARRVNEHRLKEKPAFTSRYGVTRLVYYETFERFDDAIAREKKATETLAARLEGSGHRADEPGVGRSLGGDCIMIPTAWRHAGAASANAMWLLSPLFPPSSPA